MKSFDPKNKTALTAQLSYHGRGNPPASHPITAVGNFFPGLEFNLLNIWKRVFVGIELLESSGWVLDILPNEGGSRAVKRALMKLKDMWEEETVELVKIEYKVGGKQESVDLLRDAQGPIPKSKDPEENRYFLDWANALARVHHFCGGSDSAICHFSVARGEKGQKEVVIPLEVRRLIDPDTALISQEASLPGELTESLCSPWQTDYIGCACFYWASNRPDFVNVEEVEVRATDFGGRQKPEENGKPPTDTHILGQHWLDVPLGPDGKAVRRDGRIPRSTKTVTKPNGTKEKKPFYTLERKANKTGRLLKHEDVLHEWESKFEFIVAGRDAPGGVVKPDEEAPQRYCKEAEPGLYGSVRVQGEGVVTKAPEVYPDAPRKKG